MDEVFPVVVSVTGCATDPKEAAIGTCRTEPYNWSGCFEEGEISSPCMELNDDF
jgi:Ni,Fe-hydrogenase III small subunit